MQNNTTNTETKTPGQLLYESHQSKYPNFYTNHWDCLYELECKTWHERAAAATPNARDTANKQEGKPQTLGQIAFNAVNQNIHNNLPIGSDLSIAWANLPKSTQLSWHSVADIIVASANTAPIFEARDEIGGDSIKVSPSTPSSQSSGNKTTGEITFDSVQKHHPGMDFKWDSLPEESQSKWQSIADYVTASTQAPVSPTIQQLVQIAKGPVWDGNLISKGERDKLVTTGWVTRLAGWNLLTTDGLRLCLSLGLLKA